LSAARRLAALVGALLLVRLASAAVVFQPGYTDAYYYANVARRLAAGQGLTADFIWNFIEASGPFPVPSHRFWMPLATVIEAIGIRLAPFLDAFRAAQAAEIVVACAIPVVTYRAARALGASPNAGLVAAALAGLGGAFAPGWVSLDAFAPAAVIGTAFFLFYRRAAEGDVRQGVLAGIFVGLLFLGRAEGALFGLALLALLWSSRTRRAGAAGSAIALVIGLAWLARDLSLGQAPDLLGRSLLLVRYEDFFAVPVVGGALASQPVSWTGFVLAMPQVLGAKVAALGTNAVTFVFAFGLLLVPGIARAVWSRRDRAEARAFAALAVLVYLVESIAFTLHSTHGSYFHSLAAFFPFGVALGVIGTGELLRTVERARVAAAGGIVAAAIVSAFALGQWDASFNGPYRERVAIVGRIPAGTFMAIDAAAWRWIADRPAIVTPASGPDPCTVGRQEYRVTSIVLERVHFSAYDPLYAGGPRPDFIGDPVRVGDALIFPVSSDAARSLCLSVR
jgi:hypothetical protein